MGKLQLEIEKRLINSKKAIRIMLKLNEKKL